MFKTANGYNQSQIVYFSTKIYRRAKIQGLPLPPVPLFHDATVCRDRSVSHQCASRLSRDSWWILTEWSWEQLASCTDFAATAAAADDDDDVESAAGQKRRRRTAKWWAALTHTHTHHKHLGHVNSASYPQSDGKRVAAYGLRSEGLVWLTGWYVRCGIITSWRSAALQGHETDSCKKRYSKYRTFHTRGVSRTSKDIATPCADMPCMYAAVQLVMRMGHCTAHSVPRPPSLCIAVGQVAGSHLPCRK